MKNLLVFAICVFAPCAYSAQDSSSFVSSVVRYQVMLDQLGYASGEMDGVVDEALMAAVAQFQHDRGLLAHGILDLPTMVELTAATGPPSSSVEVVALQPGTEAEIGQGDHAFKESEARLVHCHIPASAVDDADPDRLECGGQRFVHQPDLDWALWAYIREHSALSLTAGYDLGSANLQAGALVAGEGYFAKVDVVVPVRQYGLLVSLGYKAMSSRATDLQSSSIPLEVSAVLERGALLWRAGMYAEWQPTVTSGAGGRADFDPAFGFRAAVRYHSGRIGLEAAVRLLEWRHGGNRFDASGFGIGLLYRFN